MNEIKRISICGCGWLGIELGKSLINAGYAVTGSTRSASKKEELLALGIEAYIMNLDDQKKIEDFRLLQADLIIINIPPGRKRDHPVAFYQEAIAFFASSIIDANKERALPRVLFISSTSVYPNVNRVVEIHEAGGSEILSSGEACLKAEEYLSNSFGLQLCVLRLGGLIGGDRHPGRFMSGKVKNTNGEEPINLVHREDVIGIIMAMVKKSSICWGETYHFSSPLHESKRSYYTREAKTLEVAPPLFEGDKIGSYKIIDSSKIVELLGYTYKRPFL